MLFDLFSLLRDQSSLILTGIIITFVSGFIYTTTSTGFKSGGKYRTKQGAIFIYVSATIFLGLITPLINELSKIIIDVFPVISIIGAIIFGANFIINQSVPTWSHTSPKTLLIYFFSIFLILFGFLLNSYLF
ncbi:MAG: hypothetical protein QHH19_04570 [Candidatus Thermoplasmatota archaeon]|jgi:hypothetical protein|nr:hypothetical protein [Candidatus Thermoplasmatota archaeon]